MRVMVPKKTRDGFVFCAVTGRTEVGHNAMIAEVVGGPGNGKNIRAGD